MAKQCAQLGATVLMLNRNSVRADASWRNIEEEFPGRAKQITCDLMSFDSVRNAAQQIAELVGDAGLDVLCNNAAVMAFDNDPTEDGYDIQMQTNHLSHFLLTSLLMPQLERAADDRGEARIVNHSSVARRGVDLRERYFSNDPSQWGGNVSCCFQGGRWKRYAQTKMANVVFTYALHDRLTAANSKIKALVAHPGFAATNLQVSTQGMSGCLNCIATKQMAQSPADGASGILTCALHPSVISGQLYGPCNKQGNDAMVGRARLMNEEPKAGLEVREMLWRASEAATGAKYVFGKP